MMYFGPSAVLNRDAFLLSLSMVSMAELFDKTWFVALVMAMRHDKITVFWGCFAGLFVHVFIAAGLGWSVAQFLSPRITNSLAAVLYGSFALLYCYDWYTAEEGSDVIAAGKEEAESAINDGPPAARAELEAAYGTLKTKSAPTNVIFEKRRIFFQCFLAVFVAEWGDRTQIAMIGIHASQPLVPVMLGSTLAFGLLTLSAVLTGMLIGGRTLSESTVKAVCAASFLLFTVVAIRDALAAPNKMPHQLHHSHPLI